jgi:carboxymethylenebutenolidase
MMRLSLIGLLVWSAAVILVTTPLVQGKTAAPLPDTVNFASADGRTALVAYVFRPPGNHVARMPAIVMMHGRSGAYSSLAKGKYTAATLSKRHVDWGNLWAAQGYLAILVDGFGPRGYPAGFPAGSYDARPESLNEVTVRPLDAYGALTYLRKRNDIVSDHVAIQGWSNGGSATLATMSNSAPGISSPTSATGFRGGLAFYPACGLKDQFVDGVVPYAPLRVYQGSADEEVSPKLCQELVDESKARGADITYTLYPGATHDFDDPANGRQNIPANVAAKKDATQKALAFVASVFKP